MIPAYCVSQELGEASEVIRQLCLHAECERKAEKLYGLCTQGMPKIPMNFKLCGGMLSWLGHIFFSMCIISH